MVTLKSYKRKMRANRSGMRRFLTKLEKTPPRGLDKMAVVANEEMWAETDCLACANCCKTMTPTFTSGDIKRIATHLRIPIATFKRKWLKQDRSGDWLNQQQPCQFLNLENNKCSIYPVRPRDCAGFPHHTKRRTIDYIHVFKQNVELCPATYRWVELLREKVEGVS